MKYSKPSLRSFNNESEMYCENGSAASDSGCTNGPNIENSCGPGSVDYFCANGESAFSCQIGLGAEIRYLS